MRIEGDAAMMGLGDGLQLPVERLVLLRGEGRGLRTAADGAGQRKQEHESEPKTGKNPWSQSNAPRAPWAALLCPFEGQRGGVDAIAQAGGAGAIGEDVAQVGVAAGTGDLDAAHAEARVFVLADGFGVGGQHKAGPAAAGVEFWTPCSRLTPVRP